MDKHTLVCLVGESGSGKTAIHKRLEEKGYRGINSYTTRPPRYEGEDNHIFVTDADYTRLFLQDEIVAYTSYNGYHYFCTREQALESDVYVVDPDGVIELREKMGDEINIIVVRIHVPSFVRNARMQERGDKQEDINAKLDTDKIKFSARRWTEMKTGIYHIVYNVTLNRTVSEVESIILQYEGGTS